MECVERIGRGEVAPHHETPALGDFELLRTSLNGCIDFSDAMMTDTGTLAGMVGPFQLERGATGARPRREAGPHRLSAAS